MKTKYTIYRIFLPLLFIGIFNTTNAQMIIGNPDNATADKTSVLLDFEKTNNRGLQLPVITTLPTSAVDGTFIVDGTSTGKGRVKVMQNGTWFDLSTVDGNVSTIISSRGTLSENPHCYTSGAKDATKCKVVLGAETSTADGVLVLESTTKAMVLPTVTDVSNIKNPAAGMMAYVANATTNNYLLAVFNGVSWSFWKGN